MNNLFGNAARWLRSGLALLCCLPGVAVGLPGGGIITAGSGSITGSGTTLTITPDAPGAIIDWPGFSIGAGETVNIIQPSPASTILLRASGVDPSQILGALQSNGRVFLINPAGIQFGASSVTEAAGLLASTLGLSDQNFLANQLQFASGVGSGALSNEGSITAAPGGSVYLVSPSIGNSGVISAPQGGILLAAGTMVDLTSASSPAVADAVGAPASSATHSGKLLAQNGGKIWILGQSITVGQNNVVETGANGGFFIIQTVVAGESVNPATNAGANFSTQFNAGVTLTCGRWTYGGWTNDTPAQTTLNTDNTFGTAWIVEPTPLVPITLASGEPAILNATNMLVTGFGLTASGVTSPPTVTNINFLPTVLTAGGAITATVTSTDWQGNPVSSVPTVSFSSTTPGTCTVNGSTISSIAAGACAIAVAFDDAKGHDIIAGSALDIAPSWNLLGNGIYAALDVAATFGDASKVNTVWKWLPTTSKWAFYAPSLAASGTLADYAASKGYDVLSVIDGGEGFWVNAATAFTATLPTGTAVAGVSFAHNYPAPNKLFTGWNLIAVNDSITPGAFSIGLNNVMQPSWPGMAIQDITTLWAWDNAQSKWYFYAPGLEAQGGTALADYITAKGYIDFTSNNKMLGPGVGFWVNKP